MQDDITKELPQPETNQAKPGLLQKLGLRRLATQETKQPAPALTEKAEEAAKRLGLIDAAQTAKLIWNQAISSKGGSLLSRLALASGVVLNIEAQELLQSSLGQIEQGGDIPPELKNLLNINAQDINLFGAMAGAAGGLVLAGLYSAVRTTKSGDRVNAGPFILGALGGALAGNEYIK